jgi:hypothetical protein
MAKFDAYSPRIRSTPPVDTSAYSSGKVIGGLQKIKAPFNDSLTGVLKSLTVKDADDQKSALTILIFDSKPNGAYADKSSFSWVAGDFDKLCGFLSVGSSDYVSVNSKAIAEYDVAMVVQDNSSPAPSQGSDSALYYVIVSGGTPTYTAADSLKLQFGFLQS